VYDVMYTMTKTDGAGHAFVGFGDYAAPSIVFNWGGAEGGSPVAGNATLSRVPWTDARDFFIVGKDKYYIHSIVNGRADEAFNYAESRFNEAAPIPAQDATRKRRVNYQLFWGNCSTFCYDVTARALRVLHTVVIGQVVDTPAAFLASMEACKVVDKAVRRTLVIEATGSRQHRVTPWR
jgi:hypothetical protein